MPSFSGSNVIEMFSSTPLPVTRPPPNERTGAAGAGGSWPPSPESPPKPMPPSPESAALLKLPLEPASYEPQRLPGVIGASAGGLLVSPLVESSTEWVVKALVVLTGSWMPLAIGFEVPFVLGGEL